MRKDVEEKVQLCELLVEYFDARLAEAVRRPGVECPVTKEYAEKLQEGLLELRKKVKSGKQTATRLKKELAEEREPEPVEEAPVVTEATAKKAWWE